MVGVFLAGRCIGCAAAVIADDGIGIALVGLLGGGAGDPFVTLVEPRDHQRAVAELAAQGFVHQHAADRLAIREAVADPAAALDLVRVDDLPYLGTQLGRWSGGETRWDRVRLPRVWR